MHFRSLPMHDQLLKSEQHSRLVANHLVSTFSVPNSKNEVYGAGSICVEVNTTLGDCLPLGGTPRCYQRQVVQQTTTDELAFALNVNGKQRANYHELQYGLQVLLVHHFFRKVPHTGAGTLKCLTQVMALYSAPHVMKSSSGFQQAKSRNWKIYHYLVMWEANTFISVKIYCMVATRRSPFHCTSAQKMLLKLLPRSILDQDWIS